MSKTAKYTKTKTINNEYGTCTVEITFAKDKAIDYKPQKGWDMFKMDLSTASKEYIGRILEIFGPDFISYPKVGRDHQYSCMIPLPKETCRVLMNLYTTPMKSEERHEKKMKKESIDAMNEKAYENATKTGDITHDPVMEKLEEEDFWKFLRKSARNGKKLVTIRKMNKYGYSTKDIASALRYKRVNTVRDNLTKIDKLHIKYESQFKD